MADISITAGSVVAAASATKESGIAGATITAGQVVYKDTSDNKYKLADGDSATAAVRKPIGIALNGASNGQPLAIVKSGLVTIGATVVAGTAYYLSDDTPGGIAPLADIGSGDDVVFLGIATTAAILNLNIMITGVTL
jgi:hypothetical protein